MNVLEARMINTQHGIETYLDQLNTVTISELHIPTSDSPFFDLKVGIEYYRLRDENYYNSETRYFWLRIHPEMNSIQLMETDRMSLFGVKNKKEIAATKELIGEWIINTNSFKHAIKELIVQKKKENLSTKEEIQKTLSTINLLKKTLKIKTDDILNAPLVKCN